MKTSEFIKKVEELGLVINKYNSAISVKTCGDLSVSYINEEHSNVFDVSYFQMQEITPEKRKELVSILFKYVNTPIEERKEEKKYFLSFKHNMDYINLNHAECEVYFDTKDNSIKHIQTVFTDKEIEELPNWVNEMISEGHLIKEKVNNENK